MKAPSGIYSSPDARGKYKATGEFREPRRGEFYLSGAIVEAYRAPNNLSTKYWIAVKAAAAAPMHRADLHAPSDPPPVVPMADERETAQWFMSNGISADDAKKLLAAEVPNAEKTCYKFGSLAAWQPLPQAAKDALRRELARVRAESEKYEREVLKRDPNTGETNEEKEERIAAAFGMRGPAAQREFDAAMTAGDEEPEPAAQLSPAPGTFVDMLRPEAVGFVDITPEVLKTPEGCARVNQAVKELEDASANVANRVALFFEEYEMDFRHMFQRFINSHGGDGGNYAGVLEEMNELKALIATRRAKQEAFLRAMANQPPQSERAKPDPNNTTKTGPDGLLPALS